MKKRDAEQNKLVWLTPAPANNTWTIAVRQDLAQKNQLSSLDDLGRYLKEGGEFKLAASAEFIALVIGFAVGLWCYRHPARQGPVFAVLNIIQTVPSVALFGLLIAPLA